MEFSLEAADKVTAVEASSAHAQMAQQQMAHHGERVQVGYNMIQWTYNGYPDGSRSDFSVKDSGQVSRRFGQG